MAPSDSNPSIPAWQRAEAQPAQQSTDKAVDTLETVTTPAASTTDNTVPPPSTSASSEPSPPAPPQQSASATAQSPPPPPTSQPTTTLNPSDFASFRTTHPPQLPSPQLPSPQQSPPALPPPIITYPEFLASAHQPAPLITPSLALKATYATATLAAALYALGTHYLQPQHAQLTHARHEVYTHTDDKLGQMNRRLEALVGEKKAAELGRRHARTGADGEAYADSDNGSEASDPTELFHRDMGTQTTTPPPSPPAAAKTDWRGNAIPAEEAKAPAEKHAEQLSILHSHIRDLLPAEARERHDANKHRAANDGDITASSHSSSDNDDELQASQLKTSPDGPTERLRSLRHMLDGMVYGSTNFYSNMSMADPMWSTSSINENVWMRDSGRSSDGRYIGAEGSGSGGKDGKKEKREDPVEELRKEIRGVKGVLLSAKRFPGASARPVGAGV